MAAATAAAIPPPLRRGAITHIIFDMDGLLLDTEMYYTLVQEKILARFGKTFDLSLTPKMMGKTAIDSARILPPHCGRVPRREGEPMLQDMFPGCQLMPGQPSS